VCALLVFHHYLQRLGLVKLIDAAASMRGCSQLTDGDTNASPAALAAHAGLVPVPKDSANISGNQKRPVRSHRRVRRIFSMGLPTAVAVDVLHPKPPQPATPDPAPGPAMGTPRLLGRGSCFRRRG
jgi:hypothetical protein